MKHQKGYIFQTLEKDIQLYISGAINSNLLAEACAISSVKHRSPDLYPNIVDWFLNTLDTNIRVGIDIKSKSSEYQWRIAKLNCAIKYREAGQFPVSDEEMERIISEQIEVLSKAK